MAFEDRPYTLAELKTALLNLQWIILHREDGGYFPESATIVYGDGGATEETLLDEDFTPAPREAT